MFFIRTSLSRRWLRYRSIDLVYRSILTVVADHNLAGDGHVAVAGGDRAMHDALVVKVVHPGRHLMCTVDYGRSGYASLANTVDRYRPILRRDYGNLSVG